MSPCFLLVFSSQRQIYSSKSLPHYAPCYGLLLKLKLHRKHLAPSFPRRCFPSSSTFSLFSTWLGRPRVLSSSLLKALMVRFSLPSLSTSFTVIPMSPLSRILASCTTASLSSAIWSSSLAEHSLLTASWISRSCVLPVGCSARPVQCISARRVLNGEGCERANPVPL